MSQSVKSGIYNIIKPRKRTIFSGIQPTGIPHLGNYLGALKGWVNQQNEADAGTKLIYSLVDLHAITIKQDPKQLRLWRKESLAVLLAIGLDPKRSTIFYQSHVPAHSELMWILSCTASVGYLSRMTQWKSKLSLEDSAKPFDTPLQLGLFSYPVLQAADILVHRATHVPVGQDQAQHLEFARNCAGSFNAVYGKVLVEPETMLSPAKKIMSLKDPTKKMSKSDPRQDSRILLTDSEKDIQIKVKTALTDSLDGDLEYDPQTRPGISNLIDIWYHLQGSDGESIQDAMKWMRAYSKKALKEHVARSIEKSLAPVRKRYQELMSESNEQYLDDVAQEGAAKASKSANATLEEVKKAMGLL
ncbi:hypothetical protein EG327_006828 [Venturia inaequalis]|uniref:Tryptophan--tRNA ligase, mitochondrial n=1 Tax=Venturia inaequalis TaxID=5025 RepID=A0A8H3VR87_VENIN|nr:hypothetical protein EG327_006828 [Venturia inaequalis]